jgi:putative transposase
MTPQAFIAHWQDKDITDLCNRRFAATRRITVGKTYVHSIMQRHQYEITILRRNLKHSIPCPIPRNKWWILR